MAEFKISRFRYTWKGNWASATEYIRDDIVRYGGSSYVCMIGHTSESNFYDDLYYTPEGETAPTPKWRKMTDGYAWRGTWSPATAYNLGDVVSQGGNLYYLNTAHTSDSLFETDVLKWTLYAANLSFEENWQASTRYGVGDLVRYGGIVYICNTGHTSNSSSQGLEADQASWDIYYSNIEYKGSWATGTRYKVNDIVKFGGSLYRCKEGHTPGTDSTLNFDFEGYWELEIPGYQKGDEWADDAVYQIGDIVRYGGDLYLCLRINYNSVPSNIRYQTQDNPDTTPPDWELLSEGINFRGDWSATSTYKTGDVVRRGGNLYSAIIDTTADGSTLDYLDDTNWRLLTTGQNWRGSWQSDITYSINDLVYYRGTTYKSNLEHLSSQENFPGDNGSGFFFWDILLLGGENVGGVVQGDLVTFDLSRSLAGDGSTLGYTNVSKGAQGEVLSVDDDNSVIYKRYGEVVRVFYVSPAGVDDTTDAQRGTSPFKPWKTVRFACEQADDNYSGFTTIIASTGQYYEILPIIVPARTVILGDELRSTTISAAPAVSSLSSDSPYTIAVLTRISQIIQDVLDGTPITKTVGNTENQVFITEERFVPDNPEDVGSIGEVPGSIQTLPIIVSEQAGLDVQSLISDITDYINFYINSTGTNPTLVGTNTAVTSSGYTNAVLVLEANKEFLKQEAVAFMQRTYPSYSFDSDLCKRDVSRYIDAWKYDIIYTGNYKSLFAARYYRNAVLGSITEDMFYLRDATGVRNCTLTGLSGSLNPPNVFDLYQRPTGGAFCSLDAGWGPADNRTWITTRSPYIQGVTTIGSNCVGQKIDGALHDGGNKSFVSNDFTQVLSDGIGAWVLNNARAELVSVFTYYCTIGYFAENGGVIRATNGNNSYGNYGAISDGVDNTEVPLTATVNNRNNVATVEAAFSGTFADEILTLEYSNAGNNYTTASATFVGSGVNASTVFDDFRDDAVFTVFIKDTGTAAVPRVGGGGYTQARGNAQINETPGADATSITISASDSADDAEYIGLRLIITSGTGTGQYGYIQNFDSITKIATIYKESTGQPGWDHLVAGTPLVAQFDRTTGYSIEPRPIFEAPSFSAETINLSVTTHWSASTFGDTSARYTNIESQLGTGTVVGDDGLVPEIASFNVVRLGRTYYVTIDNAGAGYAVGDVLTLSGDDLGGASPLNDITITVTEISDDSTNSIINFTHTGQGISGSFSVISRAGLAGLSSQDGTTWLDTNLPSSGDWLGIASGRVSKGTFDGPNGITVPKFVAVRRSSAVAAVSLDGYIWSAKSLPASRDWNAVAYGENIFVAVAGNLNAGAISTDGETWTSTTLPTGGDSTISEWIDITYGKGKFVAIANSNNMAATGVYDPDTNTITWTSHVMDVIDDSTQKDWTSVAYGNNRFLAVSSQGDGAYSFDGETWYQTDMPKQDGSSNHSWQEVKYGQGLFFAVGDTGGRNVGADPTQGATRYAATSPDGITWTERELLAELEYRSICFGNPIVDNLDSTVGKGTPTWIAVADNTNALQKIRTGAKAFGRVFLSAGIIDEIRMIDPGSGYLEDPVLTIVDPNNTTDAEFMCRVGDGVLAQPTWLNRGLGYRTSSTRVTITGDGFADIIPVGKFVTISGLSSIPNPGSQITFSTLSSRYTAVIVTDLGELPNTTGQSAYLRINPILRSRDMLEHGTSMAIQQRVSQCRITGHDFLDVGTGNFETTNYPDLYSQSSFVSRPENEIYEEDGGKVFYTSTDQSGNFRTGELFAVEQATGIVTISADFFDLSGLTELRLGGIRVGGSGVVIREFSTDPLFTEDSNNIIPTQKAIAAYLSNRLSLGGSEVAMSSFIAGQIFVGGVNARIDNQFGLKVVIPVKAIFEGAESGIRGSILAQTMFFRSFDSE